MRVVDGIEDATPGAVDARVERYGNHVVIEVAEREYLFVAHLERGSIAVSEGAHVTTGMLLGRVGNSGSSMVTPQPHLALHLQDTAIAGAGEAIPWGFCDYFANGVHVERGIPRGGIGRGGELLGERVTPRPIAPR